MKIFRPPELQTVQQPNVPLPLSFILVMGMVVLGFFANLILAITIQMDMILNLIDITDLWWLALLGGVLPIMLIWAIATNQPWSRYLILIWFATIPVNIRLAFNDIFPGETVFWFTTLSAAGIGFWLAFASSGARLYQERLKKGAKNHRS